MRQGDGQTRLFADAEQLRMRRLQIFNWGTFDGIHNIPIAQKGFLFLGKSGSGKTTLLDALSALLTPPRWVDFNAAARESDRRGRDRNLVSYVRGAWAEQKDENSGEIATQFLRPGSTWSALVLTYANGMGRTVTLAALFWLRGGSSAMGDLHRTFFIIERPFEMRELEDFQLDLRRLKTKLSDATFFEQFDPFKERFMRLLGVENEMALRLLHKTQSAKNLGELNAFLRDFMLDRPDTFDAAERLVAEFVDLNEAHQAVVTARRQIETLNPARADYRQLLDVKARCFELERLLGGIDAYRNARHTQLLAEKVRELAAEADGLRGEAEIARTRVENLKRELDGLKAQRYELGGGRIERLEDERKLHEGQREERLRARGRAEDALKGLGWSMPTEPSEFARMTAQARQEIENWQITKIEQNKKLGTLSVQIDKTKTEFAAAREEAESLRSQPSNIPYKMLELRRRLTGALGLNEEALPFVGELIEVRPGEEAWRGAIERVMHSFALSMLVEDRYFNGVARYVNENDLHGRLIFFRTSREPDVPVRPLEIGALPSKIEIKRESRHAAWLKAELHNRFDYRCVETMKEYREADKALTKEGLIRNRDRNEKDDRINVNDRSRWVLGFDNRDKLALFVRRAQELGEKLSLLERELTALNEQDRRGEKRLIDCHALANLQWCEIDAAPLLERISAIDAQLKSEREGNLALKDIDRRIGETGRALESAEKKHLDLKANEQSVTRDLFDKRGDLENARIRVSDTPLAPGLEAGYDERYGTAAKPLTLGDLDRRTTSVANQLNREIAEHNAEFNRLEKAIENRFAAFKREWGGEAASMDATLASVNDYLTLLQRLENDNLPAFEDKFFDLLQNQSNQNLTNLNMRLKGARQEITDRMEMVNRSLTQVLFDEGSRSHLQIITTDRQLQEVIDFRQEIRAALDHKGGGEREDAERRFLVMREIVARLSNQEPEARRWRESVLDVRQHVDFVGHELDDNGDIVEIYRSGAGKSGGQRQRLTATCLAAALRYQLGGADRAAPVYAPVVLDEAFDKSDNEFTALAMKVFENFGFQMIVATPLKSVMTLEPFIGGACYVSINERRRSGVLMIEYDEARERLDLTEQAHDGAPIAAS